MQRRRWLLLAMLGLSLLVQAVGCSRQRYRVRADKDAYGRVFEKTAGTPWMPPPDFNVYPPAHSRLHDPSPIEDPCLPVPSPQLYAYELPPLPPRDNARFTPHRAASPQGRESTSDVPSHPSGQQQGSFELPPPAPPYVDPHGEGSPPAGDVLAPATAQEDAKLPAPPLPTPGSLAKPPDAATARIQRLPREEEVVDTPAPPSVAAGEQPFEEQRPVGPPFGRELVDAAKAADAPEALVNPAAFDDSPRTTPVSLPRSYWESIPADCLSRMLEFESVRREYEATYGVAPSANMLDDSPRLALEDIIELTLLNSRELQSQKESLFRAALALTLERFDYELKPSLGANGTVVDYSHNRSAGITDDSLRIPTTFQLEKMLYTGGDFLGRFANDVLLTFNGPQGFAVDVGSDLLFGLSQSLLQRDVRLENLTQAERNVVYAARDYTRFRRQLFVQQASDYYSRIRDYRQVEIDSQNYFTLAREFNQRSVEIKFGMAARTQLDQVEQQVISGRQRILSVCTALENALDSLKIRMGVPPETPLNLDLSELNLITLRDELAVNSELIQRTRTRIIRELESEARSAFVLIGSLTQLVEQMLDSYQLREQLGEDPPDVTPLENMLLMLRIEAADIDIAEDRRDLESELNEEAPDPTKVIQRRRDVAEEVLKKVNWQVRLLRRTTDTASTSNARRQQLQDLSGRLAQLESRFLELIYADQSVQANVAAEARLLEEAETLQGELESMAAELDQTIGRPDVLDRGDFMERSMEFAAQMLEQSLQLREAAGGGLVPIQIEMDDAMMTALVQRFDLMNERGFLADDWRQIKYAADDLRSVLNLDATQSLRTPSGSNRPFDFSLDDSTTSVGLTLDLPFNRRAQRNRYRTSLFDYQAALRRVAQLEDNIKFSIRQDLRALQLDRQQYGNEIAGAALASERVTGTELEVRSGFATSRDFLESQTAYVQAVSNVASRHINYIVGRLDLFLDLESLTVGENGFWDEVYDEDYQPQPTYQLPEYARPAYGNLHPRLKYSAKIRRMSCVPTGNAMIHRVEERP